jgi:hypothetical protein
MPTLGERSRLSWGKLRRLCQLSFRRRKTRRKLELREGECKRCGACCKLLLNCPALDRSNGEVKCLIYEKRPGACHIFPVDHKDIKDRNIILPELPCGYRFRDEPNGRRNGSLPGPRLLRSTWALLRRRRPNGNGH